jgi:hypothetical protein
MNSVAKAIQYKYNILNDLSVVCGCGMADVLGTACFFKGSEWRDLYIIYMGLEVGQQRRAHRVKNC